MPAAPILPYKLVLANGAFKCGSTWLRDIVKHFYCFPPIPQMYAHPRITGWIDKSKIPRFLSDDDVPGTYLSKSHIHRPRAIRLLLSHENIRILNITRDIKDVVVSHFYHYRQKRQSAVSFPQYYWRVGRYKAMEVLEYNSNWNIDDPRICFTSFESLKNEFCSTVISFASFLSIAIDMPRAQQIAELTSLERAREKRGELDKDPDKRFFRKGIVGDWTNHFTESELHDIGQIQQRGLTGWHKIKYYLAFPARRALKSLTFRQ